MTETPTLFDLPAERMARDAAIQQVEAHSSDEWIERARSAVADVARSQPDFISDDIWLTGLEKPREARALGPVMLWAVKRGLIRSTNVTRPSAQIGCHAMPRRVWCSLVYRGED